MWRRLTSKYADPPRQDEGPSFKPLVLGCACFVLNLGRTYPFHCRRKRKRASKNGWACQCSVLVRSGLESSSAGREFESPAANESIFRAGLRGLWAERVRLLCYQLCQNYMSLCVRIGKTDRLRPPLNA